MELEGVHRAVRTFGCQVPGFIHSRPYFDLFHEWKDNTGIILAETLCFHVWNSKLGQIRGEPSCESFEAALISLEFARVCLQILAGEQRSVGYP
jgi:hypothetical protein